MFQVLVEVHVNLELQCFHYARLHNHSSVDSPFIVFVETNRWRFFSYNFLNFLNFVSLIDSHLSKWIIHWINLILKCLLQIYDINLMLFLNNFHFICGGRNGASSIFQFFLRHEFNIIDKSRVWISSTFWLLGYALVYGLHQ